MAGLRSGGALTAGALWMRVVLGFKPGDPPMLIVFLLPPVRSFAIHGVIGIQWI